FGPLALSQRRERSRHDCLPPHHPVHRADPAGAGLRGTDPFSNSATSRFSSSLVSIAFFNSDLGRIFGKQRISPTPGAVGTGSGLIYYLSQAGRTGPDCSVGSSALAPSSVCGKSGPS